VSGPGDFLREVCPTCGHATTVTSMNGWAGNCRVVFVQRWWGWYAVRPEPGFKIIYTREWYAWQEGVRV
jgi:hypothetical protein